MAHFNKVYAEQLLVDFRRVAQGSLLSLTDFRAYCRQRYGRGPTAVELDIMMDGMGLKGALQPLKYINFFWGGA